MSLQMGVLPVVHGSALVSAGSSQVCDLLPSYAMQHVHLCMTAGTLGSVCCIIAMLGWDYSVVA